MTVGVQQHFPTGKFTQSRSMDDDRTDCTCSQLEVRILGIMRAVAQDMLDKGVENFTLVLDVQDDFGINTAGRVPDVLLSGPLCVAAVARYWLREQDVDRLHMFVLTAAQSTEPITLAREAF